MYQQPGRINSSGLESGPTVPPELIVTYAANDRGPDSQTAKGRGCVAGLASMGADELRA
jgi:hypothetical protein